MITKLEHLMYDESLCVPGLLSSAIFYCLMGGYRLHGSSLFVEYMMKGLISKRTRKYAMWDVLIMFKETFFHCEGCQTLNKLLRETGDPHP